MTHKNIFQGRYYGNTSTILHTFLASYIDDFKS